MIIMKRMFKLKNTSKMGTGMDQQFLFHTFRGEGVAMRSKKIYEIGF